jgi:hypothetical protein
MDVQAFERLCRRNKLQPVTKVVTSHGNILIGEGYFNSSLQFPEPHYLMLWAIERDGMDVGRTLYIGNPLKTTQAARVAQAEKDAIQFIGDSREVGRYH